MLKSLSDAWKKIDSLGLRVGIGTAIITLGLAFGVAQLQPTVRQPGQAPVPQTMPR